MGLKPLGQHAMVNECMALVPIKLYLYPQMRAHMETPGDMERHFGCGVSTVMTGSGPGEGSHAASLPGQAPEIHPHSLWDLLTISLLHVAPA